ncbi:MAG: hypothetical protein HYY57_02825, partial [Candidatus Omnitrophica bacterium]|nr:hypothetical protein [Candidatus Omnitrophota bacterium]
AATILDYCIIEYGGAGSNTANLYASGASPTIRHTTVRYSSARGMTATSSIPIVEDSLFADNATYGLYVGGFGSSPTRPILQRNTFNNNGSYPLHLEITNFPTTLANDTYTANGIQAIELVGSNPSADITILHDGLPYIVTSTININYSISNTLKTLTLQPGVTLKFAANTGLTTGAYGSNFPAALIAQGTSTQPITFTTSSATPAPGQWSGLAFYSGTTAATILDYCIIEYGGAGSNTANLYASGASPTIRHTTVRYSSAYGILVAAGSNPIIHHNNFVDNVLNGLNSTAALDGRLNWWGDASGPSGTGPGNGDGVSSSILYEPWLGTPFNNGFEWTSASDSPDPGPFLPSAGHTTFYGTLTEAGNWTVTVRNAINATVRILSGSGNSFAQDWVGDDASGQILPDGSYTYWMDSTSLSTGQSAAPAVGRISLDSTLPIADITAPTPDQMVNGAVNILGTAAGGSFSSYRLEYGPGPLPSAWTTIVFRTTAVTDGLLATWDTANLLEPIYTLRLTVNSSNSSPAVETAPVRLLSLSNLQGFSSVFSPNADGRKDTTTVSAQTTYPVNWTLTFTDGTAAAVRTFTGSSSVINQVWDGRNDSGNIVPDGVYACQLQGVEPASGVTVNSQVQSTIIVDTVFPIAQITSPTEGQVILTDGPLSFMGTANDSNILN